MASRSEGLNIVYLPTDDELVWEGFKSHLTSNPALKILVHPHFHDYDSASSVVKLKQSRYRQDRDDFIADSLRGNSPLLILEQYNELLQLWGRLRAFGPGTIYVWPTPFRNPTPLSLEIITNVSANRRAPFETLTKGQETACLDAFVTLLQVMAITQVEVGGQDLIFMKETDRREYPEFTTYHKKVLKQLSSPKSGKLVCEAKGDMFGIVPLRCLGTLGVWLAERGINVNFSLPSWPSDDLRNVHGYFRPLAMNGLIF